ncbi:HAD-IB family hydrolase [Candidatus Nephthysia bennettiae]|uniref:HAD-IB family hydrolase n=1 Tax=Candidatus Nephthysia bennettiae TaxID=3127016 RepID=A0A934KBL8_9BACT|nr:HAD-IB family hydrolase [Candidatus Dormibacteraeota bacterium]MBJ7613702.1 HAD-IB family hydrolase [Candidatus Dormibacteraeota bacterium]
MIEEGLAGKTILITGSTGFLGKSLVEKLLRSVPSVGRINLAIRPSARRPAKDRLEREVLSSPAFKRLREELGEEAFRRLVETKLAVLELDLGREGLGLSEAGREELARCEVVIHSAAAVEFDNPADLSAQTNLLGASRLVRALDEAGSRPHLVHISTAYVGGMLRGLVREELPLDPGLNWRHEAEVLSTLRPAVEEESRRPEILDLLRRQAARRLGPAGIPSQARAVERLRQRWVRDRLVERGRAHARAMGFTDIYSFTKAMAERAVVELAGQLPLSIVRPSIIESALAEPFPGWLEGFRMAEPLILAFGRGVLQDFSGLPDSLLDIIPADLVVNAVLAAAASPPPAGEHRIYHAASGSRNPLRLRQIVEEVAEYFEAHPLRDRWGQAIGTPNWTFPSRGELTARGRLALRTVEIAQQLVEHLPLGSRSTRWSDDLNEEKGRLERSLNLAELYGVYMEVDCIFDTRNLISLRDQVPAAERERFPFDAAIYDWHDYFQRVHLPTVVRMSRADSGPRKGPGPSGSTRPGPDANTALATLRRRAGGKNVLAVFDVDGTLVETNVVEYFFWMRLKDQPVTDWPRFLASMASKAPRWLYLERRSRAEFQRSFYREYEGLDVEEMRRLGQEALNAVTLRRIYPEGMRRIREHKRAGHRVLLLTGALDLVVEPLAELLEVDVDCAHLLERDGQLTGDLLSPPPAGEARATLLEEFARRHDLALDESFAYADAISDLPMLEGVATPVVVNPDARLSQVADQRGWRVERWRMAPGNWALPVPDPRSAEYREGVGG